MNIQEFLALLHGHSTCPLGLELPSGVLVPAHFHITEVGHVTKRFIDCGGTRRTQETCLLQTWVHDDTEHRLLAGKLADIFDRAGDLLPSHQLPVEIEHEGESVSQFTVEGAAVFNGSLVLQLGAKHTDCLARGICLPGSCAPSPQPELSVPVKSSPSCCSPASGCC
jgi:hypothetical protein